MSGVGCGSQTRFAAGRAPAEPGALSRAREEQRVFNPTRHVPGPGFLGASKSKPPHAWPEADRILCATSPAVTGSWAPRYLEEETVASRTLRKGIRPV